MNIIVICIFGIESVVSRELSNLGINDVEISNGRISFEGRMEDIARCNIWLRAAERVYFEADNFDAYDFDMLYDGVRKIDWMELVPPDAVINVRTSSIDSRLYSTRDCQSIAKKAIVDKVTENTGSSRLPETGKDFSVEIFIHKDNVSVCIDTTGTGLHKRGYRTYNVEAPLKETIAAALISISYWRPGRVLLDPFCGSGTFPVEAAMMAMNIAPGKNRKFAFEDWTTENKKTADFIRNDAAASVEQVKEVFIKGSDISDKNVEIARKHAIAAGVSEAVSFTASDFRSLGINDEYGILISNPPYGIRISDKKKVEGLYKSIGRKFREMDTWSKYILTANDDFENICGIRADKRRKIYNGTIKCTYYQYFGPRPPKR